MKSVYRYSLLALACLIPFGRFLSVFIIIIAINWIAENSLRTKLEILRKKPSILLFSALPLILAIGYFYSADKAEALLRIKISLPVMVLPLVIGTSEKIPDKFIRVILNTFVAAVLIAAAAGICIFYLKAGEAPEDPRAMSYFMNHIRFSLLVNMAIAVLLNSVIQSDLKVARKIINFAIAALLAGYLLLLGSLTGLMILLALVLLFTVEALLKTRSIHPVAILPIILALLLVIPVYTSCIWLKNFHAAPIDISGLEKFTQNGNPYFHQKNPVALENGHYIDIYIAENELRKEWNSLSKLPFDGKDLKGQDLNYTLRRYLTSKGLRKDSAGLHVLEPADVASIEEGIPNYRFNSSSFLSKRIYETLWEIQIYRTTGYASRHSFGQRLAYARLAIKTLNGRFFWGAGTGDVMHELYSLSETENLDFDQAWEGKPHDQFLYYLAGSGMVALILILFSWILPLVKTKKIRNPLLKGFLIICILSMLTLDTLESHYSVVFFAFFYSLLVFD